MVPTQPDWLKLRIPTFRVALLSMMRRHCPWNVGLRGKLERSVSSASRPANPTYGGGARFVDRKWPVRSSPISVTPAQAGAQPSLR